MTDQMTNTEPARPDLEGIERSARMRANQEVPGYSLTEIVWAKGSVLPLVAYALRLESELAAMTADREILLHDCVEQMNRADSEKQRADSAEQNNRILNAIVFPACGTRGITASLAPQLSIQELCAPIAANLSPEQSAEAEKATAAFGREWWEGRGK